MIAVLSAATGCSLAPALEANAIDYNVTIENTSNKLILLNAVRASYRAPMYFTRLGQITSTVTVSGNINGTLGATKFNRSRKTDTSNEGVAGLSASVSGSTSPTIVMTNLDTAEFYKGILNPVDPSTFEYYWNYGWPKELLMHIFVERADVTTRSGLRCYLNNDPVDPLRFESFSIAVNNLMKTKPVLLSRQDKKAYGPPLSVSGDGSIGGVVEAYKAGLAASAKEPVIQLSKKSKSYFFENELGAVGKVFAEGDEPKRAVKECEPAEAVEAKLDKAIVYLRSPQGIIYYLGEVIRAQTLPTKAESVVVPTIVLRWGGEVYDTIPIFKVVTTDKDSIVAVSYRGSTFAIPSDADGDRAMQVLSLVSQVFALSTSASDLPQSESVLIAN